MGKHPDAPGYKAGWCIHYRSPSYGETCAAGVRYDSLRDGDKPPLMARSPCFIKPGETPADRSPCAKLRPPTLREIEEYNAWLKVRTDHLFTAIVSLDDWLVENEGRNAYKVIECPACGSNLHVSKVGSNNHTRGKCVTKGCLEWIQ